jgi:hypothetical protein
MTNWITGWTTIFLLVFWVRIHICNTVNYGWNVPSSFFIGSWRLGLSSRWVIGSLHCFVEGDFFQWCPLTWPLLIFGKNLDGWPESKENVVSLSCWGSRWLERTAYRFLIGTVYWQEFEVPGDARVVFGGQVAVGPCELLGFTLIQELPALESTWDVCFRDFNSSFNILVINFTELS